MNLKDILAISGKPGLYKLLTSSRSNVIVESLINGKRMPVHAAHKISSLEDISIYTYEEDVPLVEVFEKIYAHTGGKSAIDHKAPSGELRGYMSDVMPEYDEDRVYDSDLRKLFQWYNLLLELGLLAEGEDSVVEDAEIVEESASEDNAEND
ncbi:MAG: DUF5606 domain-containing protein [Flavobacteriales bacterium]|nr:DUF5606 domain-containing protein [Flavobacteriales bacterium]